MDWTLKTIVCLALFYLVSCEKNNATTKRYNSICFYCECLSTKDLATLVHCSNKQRTEMIEIHRDLHVPWAFEISYNDLTEVPVFPYLVNLTSISFKSNRISKIADFAFANVTSLEKIDLSYNKINEDTLSSETFKGDFNKELYPLASVKSLNLSYNLISRLPENVFKHLTNLTELSLGHNPFKDLSHKTATQFSELSSLEKIDLSYTELRRLPDHFFAELTKLKELDISGNQFTTVPAEINYARSLTSLNLDNNLIGVITRDSFWTSNKLQILHLSNISTLYRVENGGFSNLTNLTTLWLNDNHQLTSIHVHAFLTPENDTINLKNIYIQNNALSTIHYTLLHWHDMNEINLEGNPWNCDCNFEWVVVDLVPTFYHHKEYLLRNVRCDEPKSVKGMSITNDEVEALHFVCKEQQNHYSLVIIGTIVVGCILLATGIGFFLYIILIKTRVRDWIGENVKYRRAKNEDDSASTILY